MAYEFQKLADVEAVEEFPEEGASVLIEHEGGIKKCPADGIGGGAEFPKMFMSINDSGYTFEVEGYDTPDAFVESFDKNGIPPIINVESRYPGYEGVQMFNTMLFANASILEEGYSEESLIGARVYTYLMNLSSQVMLTNMSADQSSVMDHYEWRVGGY